MFTGLVQAVGKVVQILPMGGAARRKGGLRLVVDPLGWSPMPHSPPAEGDSIAVGGVCLTLTRAITPQSPLYTFDVVRETVGKTTLGTLKPGSRVNLEHAATLATLLGGHLVQGHVDGTGTVAKVQRTSDWRLRINVNADLMPYIVSKGSIAVDGVSLTVAEVCGEHDHHKGGAFEVALIPTTLAKTTLKNLKRGHAVNIEVDLIGKTVVTWIRRYLPAHITTGQHP